MQPLIDVKPLRKEVESIKLMLDYKIKYLEDIEGRSLSCSYVRQLKALHKYLGTWLSV